MLTGHHQYGVESMRMEGQYPGSEYDPEKCRFWPSVFRENGYSTCQVGKWHTGTDTGANRDWDHQIVWNRPRYPENAGNYFYDQLIETNGGPPKLTKGYSTDNYTNWAEDLFVAKTVLKTSLGTAGSVMEPFTVRSRLQNGTATTTPVSTSPCPRIFIRLDQANRPTCRKLTGGFPTPTAFLP